VVKVIAPPRPSDRSLAGFTGGLSVIERGNAPVLKIPQDHKTRIYFVDDEAAKSQRCHAMIVVYDQDTVTSMHMHPNAESMFVVLDGAIQFTVNGNDVVVKPGQAAIFGTNDRHGLRAADGLSAASFLEFHIPAAYTTVKG
jgi:quercetin dioxygenase-like cupin family protein